MGNIRRSFGSVVGGIYRADMQEIIDQRRLARSDTASFLGGADQSVSDRTLVDGWSSARDAPSGGALA